MVHTAVASLNGAPPWQPCKARRGRTHDRRSDLGGRVPRRWPVLWQPRSSGSHCVCTIAGGAVPLALCELEPPGVVKFVLE